MTDDETLVEAEIPGFSVTIFTGATTSVLPKAGTPACWAISSSVVSAIARST